MSACRPEQHVAHEPALIPNSFDHSQELTQFSHAFFSTSVDDILAT